MKKVRFLCICVVVIILFYQFQYLIQDNRQRKLFINNVYFEIVHMQKSIEKVVENGQIQEGEKLEIVENFASLNRLLQDGTWILRDNSFYYNPFLFIGTQDIFYQDIGDIQQVKVGDRLSQKQLDYFKIIEEKLEQTRLKLYSGETGQENQNLTVKQLNQALSGLYDIRMEILKMVN